MKKFYDSFSFVVAFLIATMILEATAGEKLTRGFLLLLLFSMIVVNADKFNSFLRSI